MAERFHIPPKHGGGLDQPVRLLANMEAAEKLYQTRRAYLAVPADRRTEWCQVNEQLANWMFDIEDLAASSAGGLP